jgi:hypothetical protein
MDDKFLWGAELSQYQFAALLHYKLDAAIEHPWMKKAYINASGVEVIDIVLLEDTQHLFDGLCAQGRDTSGTKHD